MIWPAMTALQETKDWGPIPEDQWMDPDYVGDSNMVPPPPPLPFARTAKKAKVLHDMSHEDDVVIDTPEIQGEEE
jgi:hypothetical protein